LNSCLGFETFVCLFEASSGDLNVHNLNVFECTSIVKFTKAILTVT
jgi:hypothetical protein